MLRLIQRRFSSKSTAVIVPLSQLDSVVSLQEKSRILQEWQASLGKSTSTEKPHSRVCFDSTNQQWIGLVSDPWIQVPDSVWTVDDASHCEKSQEMAKLGLLRERKRASVASLYPLLSPMVQEIQLHSMDDMEAVVEGIELASYDPGLYKSQLKERPSFSSLLSEQESAFQRAKIFASVQTLARDYMNRPANKATPLACAEWFKEAEKVNGNVKVTCYDLDWLKAQGWGALLAVAQGSLPHGNAPCVVVMSYSPNEKPPVVLVGKGVTFDSGGISIKPSAGMAAMKADMGGAAVCAAVVQKAAALQLNQPVVAILPMTENMPSGTATRPGDVVTALNGSTIEIDNTDAEGRLILADALTFAQQQYPHAKAVIDVATLTGAAVVALGSPLAAVMTRDHSLYHQLALSGLYTHDRVWRLPLISAHEKALQSSIADVANVPLMKFGAGASTAAAFLSRFIHAKTTWAHIDMAGVMDETIYGVKGMSGRPSRMLLHWLSSLS